MKRAFKVFLIVGFVVALLAALATAAAMFWGLPHDGASIVIDGETLELSGLGGLEWLLALGGILIAGIVVLVVVPLALLLGLGIPALLAAMVLVVGLLLAGAVLTLACSPLLAIGLVLWWALRRGRTPRPAAAAGSATIAS